MQPVKQRMPLPPRQEFDLEGAADYLGCSTGDILYYLDKGLLRLAASTDYTADFFCVPFEKLSTIQRQELKSLYNPDYTDMYRVILDQVPKDLSAYNAPLYLSHFQRNKIKDTVHELGEPIWIFQDLGGESITIWHEGHLRGICLYEENGWIVDSYLSREELNRIALKPKAKPKAKKEAVEPKISDDSKDIDQYIAPLHKPTEVALLIVEYANKYYSERKKHPNALSLGKYLSNHASCEGFKIRTEEEMRKGKNADEKKEYDFNGYGLTARSLDDRLRKYRKN